MSMAPWLSQQLQSLRQQSGHAWLLYGPAGLGQYNLALALARSWLCEQPAANGACGACASCHAIDVRTHADLCVLMPEVVMQVLEWPLSEKAQAEIDDKKRKPSKEIRVDAMRDAIEFCQRTSARGRGKVVLVYPAEQMNAVTANALLKTLEEPQGDVKFVLATESAHQLLPTIRSRCLGHSMRWPAEAESLAWLAQQGVAGEQAQAVLRAVGGKPEAALAFHQSPVTVAAWAAFPKAMAKGDVQAIKDWGIPQLVDALHKLCHDLMAVHTGAAPRFFEARDLPVVRDIAALSAWNRALAQTMRTMNHPYQEGLMQEALAGQAQSVLHSAT